MGYAIKASEIFDSHKLRGGSWVAESELFEITATGATREEAILNADRCLNEKIKTSPEMKSRLTQLISTTGRQVPGSDPMIAVMLESIPDFKTEDANNLVDEPLPLLLDFWAIWCKPCLRMLPVVMGVHDALRGRITLMKVNLSQELELCSRLNVRGIPHLLLLDEGKEIRRWAGMHQQDRLVIEVATTLSHIEARKAERARVTKGF